MQKLAFEDNADLAQKLGHRSDLSILPFKWKYKALGKKAGLINQPIFNLLHFMLHLTLGLM